MNAAWIDFIICLLFGFLGVQRFRLGQTALGVIYIFTFGLLGLGWIYDLFRFFFAALGGNRIVAASGIVHLYTEPSGHMPTSGFVLNIDEELLYSGTASFVSTWQGASADPNPQSTYYPGMLAVTNQRIIFTGAEGTLDRKLSELTSATSLFDGISFQFGERSYPFQTTDGSAINAAIDSALNG